MERHQENSIRWTKNRTRLLVSAVNRLTGESFPEDDPTVIEAFIGLLDEQAGELPEAERADFVASAVSFYSGRSAKSVHETVSNRKVHEMTIGAVVTALVGRQGDGEIFPAQSSVVKPDNNAASSTTESNVPKKLTHGSQTRVIKPLPVKESASFDDEDPEEAHYGAGWQTRGECRKEDPELFFMTDPGSIREAKKVCNKCPVRAECLDFATENKEKFGVWGGMTTSERGRAGRRQSR